jgi:hypothetical protein
MKNVRNKFLLLRLDSCLDDIADSFNRNQYTELKEVGVISGALDHESVRGTFVEKKTVYDEISYPNGEKETRERFKYIYFEFKVRLLKDDFYLFQLINAPVSFKSFISFLSKLHPSLTIERYKFDLPVFHESLEQHSAVEKVRVTSLCASSLPFSEKSAAKIELYSEVDSFQELKKVYGEKGYILDRLVFTLNLKGKQCELSASSSGAVSYMLTLDEEVVVESFVNALMF